MLMICRATAQAIASEIQKTSIADFVLVQLYAGDNKHFTTKTSPLFYIIRC